MPVCNVTVEQLRDAWPPVEDNRATKDDYFNFVSGLISSDFMQRSDSKVIVSNFLDHIFFAFDRENDGTVDQNEVRVPLPTTCPPFPACYDYTVTLAVSQHEYFIFAFLFYPTPTHLPTRFLLLLPTIRR